MDGGGPYGEKIIDVDDYADDGVILEQRIGPTITYTLGDDFAGQGDGADVHKRLGLGDDGDSQSGIAYAANKLVMLHPDAWSDDMGYARQEKREIGRLNLTQPSFDGDDYRNERTLAEEDAVGVLPRNCFRPSTMYQSELAVGKYRGNNCSTSDCVLFQHVTTTVSQPRPQSFLVGS